MNIGELFVSLGFKTDTSALKQVQEGMLGAKEKAIAMKVAVVAVVVAVEQLMASSLHAAVELNNFALQTGLSIESLQKWTYMAEQAGISGDSVAQTIKSIQQAQAAIKLGGGNLRPFQLLGISPYEDPFKVMDELKNKIKGLDPAIATNILSELGVGQEFLSVLRGGSAEFSKLNKQFIMTHKETDNLMRLNRVWKDFWFSLKGIRDRLTAMNFEPFIKFVQIIKNSLSFFFELSMRFFDLYNSSKRLQVAIIILGAILLIAFAPITAIIIGLLLIIDDIWTGIKGGDSVTGDLLKWWNRFKILHPILEGLVKAIQFVWKSFSMLAMISPFALAYESVKLLIQGITYLIKHLSIVKDLFNKGLDWTKITTGKGIEKFKDIFKGFDFSEMFKGLGDTLTGALMPIMQLILSVIGKALGLKNIGADIKSAMGTLGLGNIFGAKTEENKILPVPPSSGRGGITNNNNQEINIKIDGSQNPKQTGDAVVKAAKEHLQRQINKSTYGTPATAQ